MSDKTHILRLPRDMAIVRSSIKDMWNLSCEGSTYLYSGAKMGAALMFGTWRRGLMTLLVLASLPFLAPVILVSMMVGGIFLVPVLCGVTAYCVLFRPASLSNFIKRFRSPKSVHRSGPRSAELVMEDLDIDSEYVIVSNETDRSEPQEFDVSSALLNAGVVEIEVFELRSPSRSTAENIFEEPDAFEAVPVTEEDKIAALIAVKSMQDDEVRSSREGSSMPIEVELHPEQILGSDTIAREVDPADSDERATMPVEDKQQGEGDEVVNDRELNESELLHESGLPEPQPLSEDSTARVAQLEESNANNDESSEVESGAGHPVLIVREQQQLEEPKFLNEGTTEAQSATEELKAVGEPEDLVESEVVKEKEDEGHTVDQLTPGKEEKRFDEHNEEIKESGQTVSASTQPFLSEGNLEHSEHELPLRDAVQEVDDFAVTEGGSEPNYESAPDSFSPSDNEQEQVDAIEINRRKPTEDTSHGLEGDTELKLKGVGAVEDVPVDEVGAPVVPEKEIELSVSEPTSKKEVPGVEEGAVAVPALEPVALVIEEKSIPVEEVAPMGDVAPVEVAAPVVEAIVKKTSEPASQVIEQKEFKAPARTPEVMEGVGAPVAEDISIVEPETTNEPDAGLATPLVLLEDEAPIVQEKGIDIPLVVPKSTSEEKEVSAVEEEDVPASTLKSEVYIMEQHPLPVASEAVDLASPAVGVPAIAEAAPTEVVASAEDSDANDLYKGSASVVEKREVKSSALMEDVIPERVEDLEAPALAGKGAEAFVGKAAAPETATSEASVPIVEPEATKEVEGKLDDVSVGLEKEMGDSVLESSIKEQHSLPVGSELPELASRVADVPAITEVAPVQEASVKAATLVEGSDAKEAEVVEAPMVIEKVVEPSVEEARTSKTLIVEPDVAREAAAKPAALEVGAEEEIPFVQEEAVLPLVASEPVSEEREVPVAEEKDARVSSLGSETSITEQHSLPVDSEPVSVAHPVVDVPAVEETAHVEEAVPVEAQAEKVEFPVVEDKDMKAPVAALEKAKVEESPVVVAPAQEGAAPVAEAPVSAFSAAEEAPDVREVERLEANGEPRQEGYHRIASNLEPSSNVQDSMAVDENLNQASQDRSVKVSDLDREDAPFVPFSYSQAQREEQGNEADVDAQKLEESFYKDKSVESHTEQDVFPTLKPLNIIQSKDSTYDEEAKTSDPIFISAPAQRRISFEGVGADDDVNMGAPPSQGTGLEGDSGEPHMGEFGGLLQSWQGRDSAPYSRISVSPSDSPRSPAEIERQIREEISTIQKIIGQEIPPQYSLWKEVETLSQIVGMELPYMADVSDLTKARHGLDLLKVVVGIK